MIMIDLCCGLKGASAAMKARGWHVLTLDNNPIFHPDILTDITGWHYQGERPDLVWASPPCNEFSREYFPWNRTGKTPSLSIYLACQLIIRETAPRFWIIENTRGAVPYFGKPSTVYYPYYLWGHFPNLGKINLTDRRHKDSYPSAAKAERAKIPYALSLSVAKAIEASIPMPL